MWKPRNREGEVVRDDTQIDLVRVMTLSKVCACGNNPKGKKLFCDACWHALSLDLRDEWNTCVSRNAENTKRTGAAPPEALGIYERMLAWLGLRRPYFNRKITVRTKGETNGGERNQERTGNVGGRRSCSGRLSRP
jgi:hypothetical protein